MADHTHIEWTDATWNPITGCSIVSPGCTHCYAMKLAGTRLKHIPSRVGLTVDSKSGPVWNGQVRLNEEWLDQPLRWSRPRAVFVCAHGDLFAENVPDEWIDRVFAVMALAPQHTFQVLTKRAKRMRGYLSDAQTARRIYELVCDMVIVDEVPAVMMAEGFEDPGLMPAWPRVWLDTWPLPNVWLGVSTERQQEADERVPELLATPAAIRFVSAEPLLGLIDFNDIPWPANRPRFPESDDISDGRSALRLIEDTRIDWMIVGGESGHGARPMHPSWARKIRDDCHAAGVPFFFKQWGAWAPHKFKAGGDLGGDVRSGKVRIIHPSGQSDAEVNRSTGGRSTEPGSRYMVKVGKKRAGRLLYGIEHNGMPEAREVPAL